MSFRGKRTVDLGSTPQTDSEKMLLSETDFRLVLGQTMLLRVELISNSDWQGLVT